MFKKTTRLLALLKIKLLFLKSKINHKMIVFFIFVGISTALWFINALGKSYSTYIEYPVRYINLPEKKVLVGDLPNYISIKVNALGTTLLKYKYKLKTSFKPIIFNIKSLTLNTLDSKKGIYYLLTQYEQNKITKQLNADLKVIDILPDTIYFYLADIIKKKVKVHPNINYKLKKQIMLNGTISISPDSIIISGPHTLINTIDSIETKQLDLKEIDGKIIRNVSIANYKNIKYNPKRVTITIPAEKYTENTFLVPIQILNIPDSMIITTFPKEIDLTYQVALSNFDKINKSDFTLTVDYAESEINIGDKLRVRLVSFPTEAKKIDFTPKFIEYILEKND